MKLNFSLKLFAVLFATAFIFLHLVGCREGSGSSSLGLVVGPTQSAVAPTGYAFEGLIKNSDPNQSLGNIPVALFNSAGQKVAETRTTIEGKFYFFGQLPDFYQVKIDENATIIDPTSYFMRLLPDGTTSPEELEISTAGKSGVGQVTTYAIKGALRDKSTPEKGAAFVLVELFKNEQLLQIQQTTKDGEFYFSGLATGTYRFTLARGSDQYMIRDDVIFELQAGGVTVPPISILLLEPKTEGAQGKQITGQLVNENNSLSVGNIRVVLRRDGVFLGDTYTTAEGRFFFFDRTPDFYEIQVLPTTYFASATSYIRMLPDGTTSPVDIKIPLVLVQDDSAEIPTFPISGKVKNARKPEETVPYILVELFKNNVLTQIQQTTAAGDFNFLGLATGSYKLSLGRGSEIFIEKDDVIFEMLDNGVAAPPVSLIFIEPKEIASASYQISGLVKAAKSNQPLANIRVALTREGTTLSETSTTTAEGKFFFFDRSPGFYEISIASSSLFYAAKSYIRILPDGTISPQELVITLEEIVDPDENNRTYNVAGVIKNKNKPEESLPYLLVELIQNGITLQVQQTTSNGNFSFENLRPGSYRLLLGRGSDLFQFRDDVIFEILSTGVVAPPVNLLFLEEKEKEVTAQIAGYVRFGENDEPLSNIKVEIWRDGISGSPFKVTYTTGEGRFLFDGLQPGLYYTRVGDGQNTYIVRQDYLIQIDSIGNLSPETPIIKLSKDLTQVKTFIDLTGHIRDSFTGAPLEYVTLKLKGYGNVLTDRAGYFFFKDVPEGIYDLEITKLAFNSLTVTVQVVRAPDNSLVTLPTNLNYFLIYKQEENMGSIAGRVSDQNNGAPLMNHIVKIYKMEKITKTVEVGDRTYSETDWEIYQELLSSTITADDTGLYDDAGTFKITHLEPGEYFIFVGVLGSEPSFRQVARLYPGIIYWTEDSGPPAKHRWKFVKVTANTTTYLSNFDPPK